MTTIDKLDIGIYIQYARRTQLIEQINQQYRINDAASIPPQTVLVNLYPKLSEIDLLLGVVPMYAPWAFFFPPRQIQTQRRSPFAFYRIMPSMGSNQEQEENEEKLNQYACETPEEEKEKAVIQGCFKQVAKINEWLSFIIGRVGQFLQG